MINANEVMKVYHETADSVDLSSHDRRMIIDKADLLMVMVVLEMKDKPVDV